jgi:hypothetical protein
MTKIGFTQLSILFENGSKYYLTQLIRIVTVKIIETIKSDFYEDCRINSCVFLFLPIFSFTEKTPLLP